MDEKRTTLYYREGSSDKIYTAHLKPEGAGWVVAFAYGRRGGSLKAGTKTESPLPYEQALRVYDGLVAEKTTKGYTPGEDGTPYTGTELAGRASAHRPQLLNDAGDAEEFLRDPLWWAQEKFDGERVLIEKVGSAVTGINKRGLVRPLPQLVADAVACMPGDFVVDGELVGTDFHAFDLLGPGPYSQRLKQLTAKWGELPGVVVTARTEAQKRALLADVTARGGEGIVLKRHDAPYVPGRPSSGGSQLKHKLVASASCIVLEHVSDKRSVVVGVHDGGKIRPVGRVTIPPNHPVPAVGSVVEVRYLYAYPQGALYQPVYLGVRSDVESEECTAAQLKFKAGTDEAT